MISQGGFAVYRYELIHSVHCHGILEDERKLMMSV